jgi:hypothetical protein
LAGEHFQQLDSLLRAYWELGNTYIGVNGEACGVTELSDAGGGTDSGESSAMAKRYILGNGHGGDEREVLMNHSHASRQSVCS